MASEEDLWALAFTNVGRSGEPRKDDGRISGAIQAISGMPVTSTSRGPENVTGACQSAFFESESVFSEAGGNTISFQNTSAGGTAPDGPAPPPYPDLPPSHGITGRRPHPIPGILPTWRVGRP